MPTILTETQQIEKFLLEKSKLSQKEISELISESSRKHRSPLSLIIEKNLLKKQDLLRLRSIVYDIKIVDLSKIKINKLVLYSIPEKLGRKYKACAFEDNGELLKVAMAKPEDIQAEAFLKKRLNRKAEFYLANEDEIERVLDQYTGLENEIEKAIAEGTGQFVLDESSTSEKKQNAKKEDIIKEDAPIAKAVKSIIENAVRQKASDIHIEPQEKLIEIRYRIDGILKKKLTLPKNVLQSLVSRIKILSSLKIDETRLPQDGRIKMVLDSKEVDFRVSTLPTVTGEKVVMRILDTSSGIITLEQLGLVGRNYELIEEAIKKPHGMILVTGPTGSGKSTTLYAIIEKINSEGINIITLEDPVEYHIDGINQCQIKSEIGYTFASGLRSILRQDPDVIMVGEIRDTETAEMAVHSALTGHVVLSTLHTNSAAGAIPRFIDMGVEPFLIASSLNIVIAQRLVRKLCDECKKTYIPEPKLKAEIKKIIDKIPKNNKANIDSKSIKFFSPVGCNQCNQTGYKGRIGIFELLPATDKIKSMTIEEKADTEINDTAIKEGMTTMEQDGVLKALAGTTSLEEVWRVTRE